MNDHTDPSNMFDPADEATAADLRAAFSGVHFDRPVSDLPVSGVTSSDATAAAPVAGVPTTSRFRRPVFLVGAAAAAAAAVAASVVLPVGGPSTAWASTPTAVSAADKDQATKACSAALPPTGAGAPSGQLIDQGSVDLVVPNNGGTISGVVPANPGEAPSMMTPPPLPTSLPPVSAVDRRGDKALAVFKDTSTSVACMLTVKDGTWTASGLMFGLQPDDPNAAVIQFLGQTMFPGLPGMPGAPGQAPGQAEGQSSIAAGAAPAGVARVELEFSDGTVAQATVSEGVYAAWFPSDMGAPTKVTMLDGQGNVVSSESKKQ